MISTYAIWRDVRYTYNVSFHRLPSNIIWIAENDSTTINLGQTRIYLKMKRKIKYKFLVCDICLGDSHIWKMKSTPLANFKRKKTLERLKASSKNFSIGADIWCGSLYLRTGMIFCCCHFNTMYILVSILINIRFLSVNMSGPLHIILLSVHAIYQHFPIILHIFIAVAHDYTPINGCSHLLIHLQIWKFSTWSISRSAGALYPHFSFINWWVKYPSTQFGHISEPCNGKYGIAKIRKR